MKIEYEVRVLEIPFDNIIEKVESLGAKKIGAYHQKRYVYDFIPPQKGRWIRLRSNGIENTLTIKEVKSLCIDGTSELEIVVSDFEEANEMLNKLGYKPRTFQENFRIEYILNDVYLDFDKWPKIPAYLEIEGQSKQEVLNIVSSLNIDMNNVTTMDIDKLYKEKYGIILDDIEALKFDEKENEILKRYLI